MAMDPIGTPLWKPISNAASQFEYHLRSLQHKNADLQSGKDLLLRANAELQLHLQSMIQEADWQRQDSINRLAEVKKAREMEVAGLQSMVENLRDAVSASQGLCNQNAEDYGVAVDRLEREKNATLSCLKHKNRWWRTLDRRFKALMNEKCMADRRLWEAAKEAAEVEWMKLRVARLESDLKRMRGFLCSASAVAVAASLVGYCLWKL